MALDLARDRGRGREALLSWTPPSDVQRVWGDEELMSDDVDE